jgi:hypothetical protein
MKLLGSFDIFKEYYNIDEKRFCFFKTLQKTVGIYKIIENKLTGLLVEDNNLYFLYGEDKFLITDSHKVFLKVISKVENEFNLMNGDEVLVKFPYSLPNSELNVSPFEYIDEDDFNWGEFIAKIINDKKRQENFVTNLMERC